ncbi:MAG: hypothetical protein AAF266_13890 [Planctomycetota bacterium]
MVDEDFFIEFDNDTEQTSVIQDRWRQRYEACEGTVVVVCEKARRRDAIEDVTDFLEDRAVYGLLGDIVKDPFGPVYEDIDGNPVGILQRAAKQGGASKQGAPADLGL